MQEAELYQAWQNRARQSQPFHSEGHRLKVIHSGQLNTRCGPDFVGARFELDGTVYQGDVECHLRPADWYRHGHQLDRAYASVVLHLVAYKPQSALDGVDHYLLPFPIPTLVLPPDDGARFSVKPAARCREGKLRERAQHRELRLLALQRFDYKVRQFLNGLARTSFEQLFYEFSFRMFGYPANGPVFQSLARQLDWAWLSSWRSRIWAGSQALFALYAGQAGFIPDTPPDDYCRELQKIYHHYRQYLPGQAGAGGGWQFAALRSHNHPHFRLAGWTRLLYEQKQMPLDYLEQQLYSRLSFEAVYASIRDYFMQPCSGYWQDHFALGRPLKNRRATVYFGPARISEWLINVILPLFAARSCTSGSAGFESYLRQFYLWLPLVCEYGGLQREFPWSAALLRNQPGQALQQGLIQLQTAHCNHGFCRQCPLARIRAGKALTTK